MGSTKWKGTPLREGTILHISSKTVELEGCAGPHDIPRITGIMPPDGPEDDEVEDAETPRTDEICAEQKVAPVTYAGKENIGHQNDTLLSSNTSTKQKKFVAPGSFYATTASTSKAPRPLFVFNDNYVMKILSPDFQA